MPTRRPRIAAAVLLAACILANTAAHAKLAGSTIHWQYYVRGGPYGTGGTFTATKPVTVVGQYLHVFRIVSDRGTITFNYIRTGAWSPSPLSLAPTIYSGIALNLASPGAFRSVSIDPATNMPGFTASHISFTPTQIQIDWQTLSFTPSTIVRLDIRVSGTATGAPTRTPSNSRGTP